MYVYNKCMCTVQYSLCKVMEEMESCMSPRRWRKHHSVHYCWHVIGEVHDIHVWFVWNSYFPVSSLDGVCTVEVVAGSYHSVALTGECVHMSGCVYMHVCLLCIPCDCVGVFVHVYTFMCVISGLSIPLLTNAARGEVFRWRFNDHGQLRCGQHPQYLQA